MTASPALVDHLFRHAAGQMVARIARILGPGHLDLAEEVVQDALLRALQTWPYGGVPDNPRGWLFQVARNRALDLIRRETNWRGLLDRTDLIETLTPQGVQDHGESVLDEELAMMFMCCHPALHPAARVPLTLKLVGGFSIEEIAGALLTRRTTIAQRLVRAKRQIRDEKIPLEIPSADALAERIDPVIEVLYLLFNEGYAAHGGENLTRADLCAEAIRLAKLLVQLPHPAFAPRLHALLALMLFQASRLPARVNDLGDLLLLSEQDRSRWDQGLIAEGFRHFDRALSGKEITSFHVEAAIGAYHAAGTDRAATDWPYLLRLYDDLLALKPTPIVALNRAIALAMVEGPEAGIRALEEIKAHEAFRDYYLLPAVLAGLEVRAGAMAVAARHYREALAMPCSAPERRFMRRELARLTDVKSPSARHW
ncbi:MAG TPA: sigma-70 family RNA polymerase sigma factor [Stellaceae bacterium]|nr:sigma-70 family RNA polymerase sigma factor [Stellaceae bacterium]